MGGFLGDELHEIHIRLLLYTNRRSIFLGVQIVRALLFWVNIGIPHGCKLPFMYVSPPTVGLPQI